ncbi:hypothetical protein P5W99_10810 [Paraburkholderia sp. A3BS-1L]|uniref:hypothetical protein n=1 Tax=Paraburkholderia sp. A3BS-1L TaxID=3028375 RepID=UPI003DA7E690
MVKQQDEMGKSPKYALFRQSAQGVYGAAACVNSTVGGIFELGFSREIHEHHKAHAIYCALFTRQK